MHWWQLLLSLNPNATTANTKVRNWKGGGVSKEERNKSQIKVYTFNTYTNIIPPNSDNCNSSIRNCSLSQKPAPCIEIVASSSSASFLLFTNKIKRKQIFWFFFLDFAFSVILKTECRLLCVWVCVCPKFRWNFGLFWENFGRVWVELKTGLVVLTGGCSCFSSPSFSLSLSLSLSLSVSVWLHVIS